MNMLGDDHKWDVHERKYEEGDWTDFMPKGESEFVLPINLNKKFAGYNSVSYDEAIELSFYNSLDTDV